MPREGLTSESQTLWDQLDALATVLQPTYAALRQHGLAAPVIGAGRLAAGVQRDAAAPGRWCYGKTPMQTFLDSVPLAKEKLLAVG